MPSFRARFLPRLALALLPLLLYARTLGFDFVFDDQYLVVNNAFLREPFAFLVAFGRHFWYGTPIAAGYYRPLVTASLSLNGQLFGWSPAGFHLINLMLHAANTVLLFFLARRLGATGKGSWVAAAIFALHPAAAWPVGSIVARVDLLPAFFVLLAWYSFARPLPGARSALLTGLFFLCALLCKESAVAFFIIPLMAAFHPAGSRTTGTRAGSLWAVVSCCLALSLGVAMRLMAGVPLLIGRSLVDPLINPLSHLPFPGRLYAALRLSGRYLLYLVLPARLSDAADYNPGSATPFSLRQPGVLFGLCALGVLAAVALLLWKRNRPEAAPLAFALLSFLPASNLLAPIGSLYAQNFLYLPLLGMTLALALAAGPSLARAWDRGPSWRRTTLAAGLLFFTLLARGSSSEAAIWQDGRSLFSAWTERFPRYSLAWSGLGVAQLQGGNPSASIASFDRAIDLNDRNSEAQYNLGFALIQTAQDKSAVEAALAHTRRAAELDPTLVQARVNASKMLLMLGRPGDAEAEAREALRLAPGFTPARVNLAESLFRQERYKEAAAEFRDLASSFPSDPNILSPYIVSLIHAGDLAEARTEAEKARQALPDLAWFDFCLARIEAREGHRTKSRAMLRHALAKDPAVRDWIKKVDDLSLDLVPK